jgi:pimeloyl-ACP methyl ester carboxylesterase
VATFCLVHGAWHDGACWEPLVACLRARGHDALTPDLPYHDPEAGYAARAQPVLDALAGVDGDLVLVGHSLGSAYAPLAAMERPGSLLVHLCPRLGPFTPPPRSPDPFRTDAVFPPTRPDGLSVWDPELAVTAMYGRLPPATARALALRLRPLAPPADDFPLPGHPDVPTALIYTAEDEIFAPEFERFMARELLRIDPFELPGGHFPMVEQPEALAGLLSSLV